MRPPLITPCSFKGLNEKARLARHQDSLLGPWALFHRIAMHLLVLSFDPTQTSRGASVLRFTLATAKEREPGYDAAADRIGKRL